MAERLVEAEVKPSFASTSAQVPSSGVYGCCCLKEDAVAAYQVAVAQPGIDHLGCSSSRRASAGRSWPTISMSFRRYSLRRCCPPLSLLGPDRVVAIEAPLHIIVSDSNLPLMPSDLRRRQHTEQWPFGATVYVAETERAHAFDITDGPIDWSDPGWVERYHRGAMQESRRL